MPPMTATAQGLATQVTDGDSRFSPDPARAEARRRLIVFAGLGIAFYAVAMVATLPAGVLVKPAPWRLGVAGTLWNGEVAVRGGTRLSWQWAPLRSLTSLGLAVDWQAVGRDTQMGGRALIRGGRVVIDSASGTASTALLEAAWPGLGFHCDLPMRVDVDRVAMGGGDQALSGKGVTRAGQCASAATPGAQVPVAPLAIVAKPVGDGSMLTITPVDQPNQPYLQAKLPAKGPLSITMTPAGATALPFMGIPGGVTVETEL